MTGVIVAIGAAIILFSLFSDRGQRRRALDRLEIGADSSRVATLLGRPAATCPPGTLDHLSGRFRGGTAPAAAEAALERLRAETAVRWIYPGSERGGEGRCVPGNGDAEVGFDRNGRVSWYLRETGSTTLVLPDGMIDTP